MLITLISNAVTVTPQNADVPGRPEERMNHPIRRCSARTMLPLTVAAAIMRRISSSRCGAGSACDSATASQAVIATFDPS